METMQWPIVCGQLGITIFARNLNHHPYCVPAIFPSLLPRGDLDRPDP